MERFYEALDPICMALFRILPDPIASFFLGTFLLALTSVLIGQTTLSIAFLINRKYVERLNDDLVKWNNLSIDAIKAGDKEAYESFNEQANEAFGRLFFLSVAYSAASLWPAPFALGWMQRWYSDIAIPIPFPIPFLGSSARYTLIFILSYLLAALIFSLSKPYLPYFKWIHKMLATPERERERLRSFTELFSRPL
ncbi:MAG: hypothetical protein N2260_10335 [Syntrophobacterales bacterium]|nr:hypothetical protein [Syntrophobacterales bacterium]